VVPGEAATVARLSPVQYDGGTHRLPSIACSFTEPRCGPEVIEVESRKSIGWPWLAPMRRFFPFFEDFQEN
jgi:hypothetical protein